MQFTSAKNHWILPMHSNVTSKIVVGFTLRGPPCTTCTGVRENECSNQIIVKNHVLDCWKNAGNVLETDRANITSSSKPEVYATSKLCQKTAEPWPQATCAENSVTIARVVFWDMDRHKLLLGCWARASPLFKASQLLSPRFLSDTNFAMPTMKLCFTV